VAEATFYVLADPIASAPAEAMIGSPAEAVETLAPRVTLERGLLAPLRRDAQQGFATGYTEALVRSSIRQILGTRADDGAQAGELPWRPEFGSLLERLRFMNMDDSYGALVRNRVANAVGRWEPRARIKRVETVRREDGVAETVVVYDIVQAGTENVLVRGEQVTVPLPG
jgi:phage baseplate assembly protein W